MFSEAPVGGDGAGGVHFRVRPGCHVMDCGGEQGIAGRITDLVGRMEDVDLSAQQVECMVAGNINEIEQAHTRHGWKRRNH